MSLKIHWLNLEQTASPSYLNANGTALQSLEKLATVNIFVGPNNSGKSRLMRQVACQEVYEFGIAASKWEALQQCVTENANLLQKVWQPYSDIRSIGQLSQETLRPEIPRSLSTSTDSLQDLRALAGHLASMKENTQVASPGVHVNRVPLAILSAAHRYAEELKSRLAAIDALDLDNLLPNSKLYIPVLRGMRTFQSEAGPVDIFQSRTVSDYFAEAKSAPTVFTGLSLYEDVRNQLLGPRNERDNIRAFEKFLGDTVFDAPDVALIPRGCGPLIDQAAIGRELT